MHNHQSIAEASMTTDRERVEALAERLTKVYSDSDWQALSYDSIALLRELTERQPSQHKPNGRTAEELISDGVYGPSQKHDALVDDRPELPPGEFYMFESSQQAQFESRKTVRYVPGKETVTSFVQPSQQAGQEQATPAMLRAGISALEDHADIRLSDADGEDYYIMEAVYRAMHNAAHVPERAPEPMPTEVEEALEIVAEVAGDALRHRNVRDALTLIDAYIRRTNNGRTNRE